MNNHVRQLKRSENGFEIWRQLRQRFSGGQRTQQLQLLQRIMESKIGQKPQQGQQFNQWLTDIRHYELETAMPIEESIKIATAINNLRGAVRQHLLLSVRPTTTWREVHNIVQNFLVSTWVLQEGTSQPSRMSTTSRRAKVEAREKARAKESPTTTTLLGTTTTKEKERRGRTTTSSTTSSTTTNNQTSKGYNNNNNSGKGKHNNRKGEGKSGKGKNNFNNYAHNDVYCYFCGRRGHYASSAGAAPTEFILLTDNISAST